MKKKKKSKDLQSSSSPEKTYTHRDAVFQAEGTKIAKALKLMCFKHNKKTKVNTQKLKREGIVPLKGKGDTLINHLRMYAPALHRHWIYRSEKL